MLAARSPPVDQPKAKQPIKGNGDAQIMCRNADLAQIDDTLEPSLAPY